MRPAILFIFCVFFLFPVTVHSQIDDLGGRIKGLKGGQLTKRGAAAPLKGDTASADTASIRLKTYPASMYRYVYMGREKDTLTVDTLLRPQQRFRANFTQRDLFVYMPFQNIGQPLNPLAVEEVKEPWGRLVPEGKLPVFRRAGDIPLYHTPTPYSRLFYLSGNKQGQMLDSRIAITVTPHWYIQLGYLGLSSLGYYQHGIASHENWFLMTGYKNRANTFEGRIYVVKNHLENEEYGGILDETYFEQPGRDYVDRGKIPVRLNDKSIWHSRQTGLMLRGRPWKAVPRMYLAYQADFLKGYYRYEGAETGIYGPLQSYSLPYDSTGIRYYRHRWGMQYGSDSLSFSVYYRYERHFVTFDTVVQIPGGFVSRQNYTGYRYAGMAGEGKFRKIHARVEGAYDFAYGQYETSVRVVYRFRTGTLTFTQQWSARQPAFYKTVYQSRFVKFNWKNDFPNTTYHDTKLEYRGRLGKAEAGYFYRRNLSYFGTDSLPRVYGATIQGVRVDWERDFGLRKWHLYPRIRWQTVTPNPAFDLPRWNVRVMAYYRDRWFRQHMDLQTGLVVRYFSPYFMSAFNPLTNTFVRQERRKYGGFYLADLFLDFKVKRFRAFLALEHFNALWEKYHPAYYSAPYYPYADEIWRVAIIWEFVN